MNVQVHSHHEPATYDVDVVSRATPCLGSVYLSPVIARPSEATSRVPKYIQSSVDAFRLETVRRLFNNLMDESPQHLVSPMQVRLRQRLLIFFLLYRSIPAIYIMIWIIIVTRLSQFLLARSFPELASEDQCRVARPKLPSR